MLAYSYHIQLIFACFSVESYCDEICMELLLISMNSQVAFSINWNLICPIKPIKCESKLAINQNKPT